MSDLLERLQHGLRFEDRDVVVPWLVGEAAFLAQLGIDQPRRSAGGCWPLVTDTLLGVRADFALSVTN